MLIALNKCSSAMLGRQQSQGCMHMAPELFNDRFKGQGLRRLMQY